MSYIQFESAIDKEQARRELREAREELLAKEKRKAEERAARKTQELLKGTTNWMLPSVSAKFETSGKKEKAKKLKKNKKSKKSKKSGHKKKKRKHTSSSSSEEDDDSSEESRHKKSKKLKKSRGKHNKEYESTSEENSSASEKWMEKPQKQNETKLMRDNWMMDSAAFSLKTFSKDRTEIKEKEPKPAQYDPCKSERELNPHWKTTGTGLPSFQKPKDQSDDEDAKPKRQTHPISHISSSSNNWRKKPTNTESQNRNVQISKKDTPSSASETSSSSDEGDVHKSVPGTTEFLTDQQMNELGAKILKAEILGNMDLANELKIKLEQARLQRTVMKDNKQVKQKISDTSKATKQENSVEHVLLTHTDKMGNSRPLKTAVDPRDLYGGRSGRKNKSRRIETHEGGERVRYFPDDDKYDIKQMFEREKYTTAADSNLQFADIASKHKNPNDDLDDIFADKVRQKTDEASDKKELQRAIRSHEKLSAQLENCDKCFDSVKMNKSLIVSMGEKVYLALPWHRGLQTGHCLIVPTQHANCCTQLDEDTFEEIENFRKSLTRMFQAQKKDVIFFEIANKLHRRPHLSIHCVPIPMNQGEMAPFYFKKAIEESEHEWSVNKQLVTLRREKGLRNCIPKGLPYFWVNFGMDSGFAHVIEDENRFPSNFALEIIGGMLHLDTSKWRKPQMEQNSITKVKLFADSWKKYDCTQ